MRVPTRKPGKYTGQKIDPCMTMEKYRELREKLERLKKFSRPRAVEEVKTLALMGDFSENAAYGIAKGRLRGINQRIIDIDNHLKSVIIIQHQKDQEYVQLGHTVTVEMNGRHKTYQVLGSAETDPSKGIISYNSPIGAALLGRKIGDRINIFLADREMTCKIIKII